MGLDIKSTSCRVFNEKESGTLPTFSSKEGRPKEEIELACTNAEVEGKADAVMVGVIGSASTQGKSHYSGCDSCWSSYWYIFSKKGAVWLVVGVVISISVTMIGSTSTETGTTS